VGAPCPNSFLFGGNPPSYGHKPYIISYDHLFQIEGIEIMSGSPTAPLSDPFLYLMLFVLPV
jgi:hypothetical protein